MSRHPRQPVRDPSEVFRKSRIEQLSEGALSNFRPARDSEDAAPAAEADDNKGLFEQMQERKREDERREEKKAEEERERWEEEDMRYLKTLEEEKRKRESMKVAMQAQEQELFRKERNALLREKEKEAEVAKETRVGVDGLVAEDPERKKRSLVASDGRGGWKRRIVIVKKKGKEYNGEKVADDTKQDADNALKDLVDYGSSSDEGP